MSARHHVIQHTEARLTKAASLALGPAAAGPSRRAGRAPVTSRHALAEVGFEVIEQRQPSLLFGRSVLITGEVDRVTGFEKGFPIHQAWRGGRIRWSSPGGELTLSPSGLLSPGVDVKGRFACPITGHFDLCSCPAERSALDAAPESL